MVQRELFVCCEEIYSCKLASPVSYHFRSSKIETWKRSWTNVPYHQTGQGDELLSLP